MFRSTVPMIIVVAAELLATSARASDPGDDADLLKEARGLFQPLPKDMATAGVPRHPGACPAGSLAVLRPANFRRRRRELLEVPPTRTVRHGRTAEVGGRARPAASSQRSHGAQRRAFTSSSTGMAGSPTSRSRRRNRLLGPAFGNPDFPTAMARVKAIPGYAAMFREAFPGEADPISEDNWGKAIGAYERTLVSPSRFDDYLDGKPDALSAAERKGLRTFIDTGCVDCHKGPGLGGSGSASSAWSPTTGRRPAATDIDKGRFGVTNDPADLYKFKVAGLAQRRDDAPLFPRWLGRRVAEGRPDHGQGPARSGPFRPRGRLRSSPSWVLLPARCPRDSNAQPVLPPGGFREARPAAGNGKAR